MAVHASPQEGNGRVALALKGAVGSVTGSSISNQQVVRSNLLIYTLTLVSQSQPLL